MSEHQVALQLRPPQIQVPELEAEVFSGHLSLFLVGRYRKGKWVGLAQKHDLIHSDLYLSGRQLRIDGLLRSMGHAARR